MSIRIRIVKVLQGEEKAIADKMKLDPNDLVIVKYFPKLSLEKIEGDPVVPQSL